MTIRYKKKIVAFIDVLGFGDIVLNENHNLIQSYFSFLTSTVKEVAKRNRLEYFYISDTILISADDSFDNFKKIIYTVRYLQVELLARNVLLRGAVTIGNYYSNRKENIIVGPALVNSYQLESVAKYPRVIIDRSIISHYKFDSTEEFLLANNRDEVHPNNIHDSISVDKDNYLYINYASYLCSRRQHFMTKNYLSKIHLLLKTRFYSYLHIEKYAWLKEKVLVELEKQFKLVSEIKPITHSSRIQRNTFRRLIPTWIRKFNEM